MPAQESLTTFSTLNWNEGEVPLSLKRRGDGGIQKYFFLGECGKDAHGEVLIMLSGKDKTEADDDEEGKGKVPAEGCPVPEKFIISGHEHGPYSLAVHHCYLICCR